MSDYKLILISDNSDKLQVRYRKKNDRLWNTVYIDDSNPDNVIDLILKGILNVTTEPGSNSD